MFTTLIAALYIAFDSLAHHFVCKQLSTMSPQNGMKDESLKYKGYWHWAFLGARTVVWLGLSATVFLLEYASPILISASILLIIALGHEVIPGGFKITATCEKWGDGKTVLQKIFSFDFDCAIIAAKKHLKINLKLVMLFGLAALIIYYYLSTGV